MVAPMFKPQPSTPRQHELILLLHEEQRKPVDLIAMRKMTAQEASDMIAELSDEEPVRDRLTEIFSQWQAVVLVMVLVLATGCGRPAAQVQPDDAQAVDRTTTPTRKAEAVAVSTKVVKLPLVEGEPYYVFKNNAISGEQMYGGKRARTSMIPRRTDTDGKLVVFLGDRYTQNFEGYKVNGVACFFENRADPGLSKIQLHSNDVTIEGTVGKWDATRRILFMSDCKVIEIREPIDEKTRERKLVWQAAR